MGKTELEQAHRVVHFSCRRDRDLPATFPCFHKCCLCVPAHAHSPHGLAALTPPVCTPGSGTALPIQGNTSPASRHTLFSTVFAWLSSSNAFPCCCKIREKQGGKTRNFSQRELISLPKGKKKKKVNWCLFEKSKLKAIQKVAGIAGNVAVFCSLLDFCFGCTACPFIFYL